MSFKSISRRLRETRGATLVEYSLAVGLVVVASLGAITALTDSAGDRLDDRGDAIGHPVEPGGPGTTAPPTPSSTSSSTTSTTAPFSVAVAAACSGTGGNENECTFTLSPPPAAGDTVVWTIAPTSGYTGSLPTVTFTVKGKRTIEATVNGQQADPINIDCKESGNPKIMKCSS